MIELVNNTESILPNSFPCICIIRTDITETEIMVRRLASDAEEKYPEIFCGDSPQIFYRMKYTPPYGGDFMEIKNIMLQIRQAAGIRSYFHGIIGIDVSKYKGHEEEEYFTIFLKYLFDNTHGSKTVFICNQYTDEEIKNLINVCIKYFPVHYEKIIIFEQKNLPSMLEEAFRSHQREIDSDAMNLMVNILCSKDLYEYRTLQLIDRLPEEFIIRSQIYMQKKTSKTISLDAVREYFKDPHSSICMMAGHSLIAEKEKKVEYSI